MHSLCDKHMHFFIMRRNYLWHAVLLSFVKPNRYKKMKFKDYRTCPPSKLLVEQTFIIQAHNYTKPNPSSPENIVWKIKKANSCYTNYVTVPSTLFCTQCTDRLPLPSNWSFGGKMVFPWSKLWHEALLFKYSLH